MHWVLLSAPPGCVLRSITLLAAPGGGAAGLAYAPATVMLRGWAEGAKGGGNGGGGSGGGFGGSNGAGRKAGGSGGWTAPPAEQGAMWYDNDEFRWDGSIVHLLPAPPLGETDLRHVACACLELRGGGDMIDVRVAGLVVTCERYMTASAVAEREAAAERAHARRMDEIEERRAAGNGSGGGGGFLGAAASAGAMASAATASQTLAKRAKAMSCVDALSSASSADELIEVCCSAMLRTWCCMFPIPPTSTPTYTQPSLPSSLPPFLPATLSPSATSSPRDAKIFLKMEELAPYLDRKTIIKLAKERRVALGSQGWTRQVAVSYGQVMRKIS